MSTIDYRNASPEVDAPNSGPVMVNFASVTIRPVEWFWPNRVPMGKLSVLYGPPGVNKSFLSCDLAARATRGSAWPDDPTTHAPKGNVILMNCEDALDDTVAPRLLAAGADLSRVEALVARRIPGEDGKMLERDIDLQDIVTIREAVQRLGNVQLIVVDPVSGYMGRADSHNNAETRGVLRPLAVLAAACGAAVILISHTSKNGSQSAIMRAMGSIAFVAAARAAFLVLRDKDKGNPKRRFFVPTKNNLGNDTSGLAFAIIEGAVAWEPEPILQTADELLAASERPVDGQQFEWETAADWLTDFLAGGGRPATECEREGVAAGFAKQTIRRAREQLGIKPKRERFADGGWWWCLPKMPLLPSPSTTKTTKMFTSKVFTSTEQDEQEEHLRGKGVAIGGGVRVLDEAVHLGASPRARARARGEDNGSGQAAVRATCLSLAAKHSWPPLTLDGTTSAMSAKNWQDFTRDAPIKDVGEAMLKLDPSSTVARTTSALAPSRTRLFGHC